MTARANSLTERVTGASGSAANAFTMPTNDVRALLAAFDRLGYRVDPLREAAGLRDTDLSDPDGRVSCATLDLLMSAAQRQRFTPNLALEMARVTPLGAYPLLDYLVITSDSVGAGVRQLARYFRLIGNPVDIQPREDVDPIRIEMRGAPSPFGIEYLSSLMVLHLRSETDGRFAAAGVTFAHRPDDVAGFEQVFACAVTPGGLWNGVVVSPEAWRLPLRRRDPVLRQLLEAQADDGLARLPSREGLAADVQRTLKVRMAGGDTRIGAVARQLAMSARTLQRRLDAEGVSYQALVDESRKEAAGRYIAESMLSIGEIAYLVGYSEPAPFHRAFKRWHGVTPERFRRARGISAARR